MEVDPAETMERELHKWTDLMEGLAVSSSSSSRDNDKNTTTLQQKLQNFHEWLSGIPGIDEATALSSAVTHIESQKYDLIVFDTAPTGHTLKLLGMPEVLQQGIEKLQSWQSTLWNYWEVLKGLGSGGVSYSSSKKRVDVKDQVAKLLEEYKLGIQKVACMLQDQDRTRFVVVCIAEFLSVSETRRLLIELKKNQVKASHVIVNQLVIENALSTRELSELEALAEVGNLQLNQTLLGKTVHACRLTTARKGIQEKYLDMLKSFPEVRDIDGICEVPLLAEEVTGNEALVRFADYMVDNPPVVSNVTLANDTRPIKLYEDQIGKDDNNGNVDEKKQESNNTLWTPTIGDAVRITSLEKSAQYNGLEGTVVSTLDTETNRCGIRVEFAGQVKTLALQVKNLELLHDSKKARIEKQQPAISEENVNKAKELLDDPEIKTLIDANPKFRMAVEDVLKNPMNFMKYLTDPEMSPLISKAMSKLKF